ncbi:MAG: PAS domain S-box protein [Syntrophorhabdales bacterium]
MERLVHELQVHQIELEMQNEELKRAQLEIAESREKYIDLYDFAPVGYFSFDRNGVITEVNLTGASLVGIERTQLMGKPFSLFVNPQHRDIFFTHCRKTREASQGEKCELLIQRKDGSRVPVLMESIAVSDAAGDTIIRSAVTDFTERKAMEDQLLRYQLLARHSRDIILFVRRADGRIVEANDAAVKAYGYSREELLFLEIYNLRGPKGYPVTDAQMDVADSSGILFETEHRRKDGTTFPVEVSSRGVSIGGERILLSVVRDITERKQAEEALRENRVRLESVLDSITDRYLAYDHDWRLLEVNREAEQLLGRKASEVVGRSLFDFYPGAEESELFQHYRRAVAGGKPVHFESRSPVSGEWHEIHAYPQPDRLEIYARNINGRKEAEEALRNARDELELRVQERTSELQEAQGKLMEQSRILESFFTSTITPLVFLDRTFNFVRVNAAFAKACGKEIGEFPGRNYFEFYPHDKAEAVFRKVIETKAPYQATVYPFTFPDHPEWGITYWDWTLHPLLNEAGEVEFLVFSLEDVTEQQRAEQQLRQAQKLESIGTLAGGIAHDFNNMLAVVLGNAELALDDLNADADPAGPARNVKQIVNASKRAADLVRQILMFSRKTEQGKNALKLAPLVKETYKLLRGSLPSTIRMKLDLRATFDTIMGDPSQIQQVLMNLCINAAHAMREKGGTLLIGLSDVTFVRPQEMPEAGMEPGAYVILSVKDMGTGMTDDVQKRMFEPFFTTKEAGQGTGMGLAVVYGVVKSHGGAISVQSRADEGSTFTIFLPCAEATAKEEQAETGPVPGGKERILFVDDEPAVVDMASQMLQRLGYNVTVALSGPDALKTFLDEPDRFDLVITDQTMPDLTGIELARRILEVRQDVPIVLTTGYSETVSPEKAMSAGIKEFVMKPIVKRRIAETIRAVLNR